MARVALADGTTCLAATPHGLQWIEVTGAGALRAQIDELGAHLAAQGVPLRVVAGAEMALISSLPQQIDAGQYLTLNGSRYLLLELPYTGLPGDLEEIIFQVQVRELVPILAHPERNADLQRHPALLRRFVERGLLVQVTAGSLEGRFGGSACRFAQRLLREGMVHVIASDAHSLEGRPPQLAKAQDLAAKFAGAERALAMVTTTPTAILADEPLDLEPPKTVRKRRWFWW